MGAKKKALLIKWNRVFKKIIARENLQDKQKDIETQIQKAQTLLKFLESKKEETELELKRLCLPTKNMHQNELVDSYVEFQSVDQPKRRQKKQSM